MSSFWRISPRLLLKTGLSAPSARMRLAIRKDSGSFVILLDSSFRERAHRTTV